MNQKRFLISLRCGRLANRLVLFANVIALARERGYRVSNVTFHSYAHLFETTRRDIYCRFPVPERQSVWDRLPGTARFLRSTRLPYRIVQAARALSERFPSLHKGALTLHDVPAPAVVLLDSEEVQARIAPADLVFLHGWRFRAPSCLPRHAAEIRDYFRPVPELRDQAGRAVEKLRLQATILIGVHIRHGDYRTFKKGKYYFPAECYAGWMRALAGQLTGRSVAFFVCSDEPRTREEFAGLTVGLGTGSAVGDLYALAECDYVLGPPSTFTQWASFYGNRPMLHLESRDARIELDRFKVSDLSQIP